ncbi:cupin domain-containing protein [Verrucomicrobiota bacterium]
MHTEPDSAEKWIKALDLKRHPEGGYFAETYRSAARVPGSALAAPLRGDRSLTTAIYFLLESGDVSALHRLRSDEVWHFYAGSSLRLYLIDPDGEGREVRLGRCDDQGEAPQAVVPAGTWFGARVSQPGSYALCGCTVSPGFEFEDFELGRREELLRRFPGHREWILSLTADACPPGTAH